MNLCYVTYIYNQDKQPCVEFVDDVLTSHAKMYICHP